MSKATKQEDLAWQGKELINRIVQQLSNSEAVETITDLRDYMSARIEQCSTKENNSWE